MTGGAMMAGSGHAPIEPGAAVDRVSILKFVTLFGCGGTERQFVNLGLALDPARYHLRFGCMRRAGHHLAAVEARGIPAVEYRIRSFVSLRFPRMQWRFARDLVRDRVAVVHAYNFYANVFAVPAARLAGAPVVIASIRDRGVYLTRRQLWVQRQVCRLADCVLVNAEAVRDWLVAGGYDPARIEVIHNGIDLAPFEREGPDLRRALGLPPGTPLVMAVSRLSPKKGLEQFLDAAAALAPRHPTARWVVVGGAERGHRLEHALQARARRLGLGDRALFLGFRSDVPQLLKQATVSVQPSLSEGLSNVVLESMAAGAAVVATRVGGTPEAITDGATGVLVPPADVPALAAAIGRLLDEPAAARRLGEAARLAVRERFSMEAMVRATERLYAALLERRAEASGRRAPLARRALAERKL